MGMPLGGARLRLKHDGSKGPVQDRTSMNERVRVQAAIIAAGDWWLLTVGDDAGRGGDDEAD